MLFDNLFILSSLCFSICTDACLQKLLLCVMSDLEWKIIYVGSAESEEYDQVLDSVLVGPVPAGRHMFVFQVSKLSKYIQLKLIKLCKCVCFSVFDSKVCLLAH